MYVLHSQIAIGTFDRLLEPLPFRELRSLAILSPDDRSNRVKKGESVEAHVNIIYNLFLRFHLRIC
jgi:hypothetical protein